MRINVYVDGFNLYFGSLKGRPYKWLDLEKMCGHLLPRFELGRIRYFTALVKERPDNLHAPVRQQAYLRALGTLPAVEVHLGSFLTKPIRAGVLGASQFPERLTDGAGSVIRKPAGW